MSHFRYQALDPEQRPVSGELESESVQQAIADLAARGLTVQSIAQVTSDDAYRSAATVAGGARFEREVEQAVLRAQIERVRVDGAALAPALRAYAQEMPWGRRRRELLTLTRMLEQDDFADVGQAIRTLPDYWIPLLSAAASSRDPGRVLLGFLEESQQADDLRRQWWLALSYPLAIACLTAVVLTAISLLIIPGFREIFSDFGLSLPGLTRWILAISAWINSGWILLIAAIILVLGAFLTYGRAWLPLRFQDWLADRLRVPYGRTTAIARFTQFLADLLEAGVTIPDALRIAGLSTRRRRFRQSAGRLANHIESGADVRFDAYEAPLTAMVLHALRPAVPLAARIALLTEIRQSYAERAQARLSWTRGILEPLAIIVIGLAVGTVVIALFLPLVRLIDGLSK